MPIEFGGDGGELQLAELSKAFCNRQILDRPTSANDPTSIRS
jgi:hypothetical protein